MDINGYREFQEQFYAVCRRSSALRVLLIGFVGLAAPLLLFGLMAYFIIPAVVFDLARALLEILGYYFEELQTFYLWFPAGLRGESERYSIEDIRPIGPKRGESK